MVNAGTSDWIWLVQMVARPAGRGVKLCTGVSSSVRLRAAFLTAWSERWAAATGVGPFCRGGGSVVAAEQDWRKGLFHVPAEVGGQRAQEHLGTDPVG